VFLHQTAYVGIPSEWYKGILDPVKNEDLRRGSDAESEAEKARQVAPSVCIDHDQRWFDVVSISRGDIVPASPVLPSRVRKSAGVVGLFRP
jgi:hypothetical protein